MDIRIMVGQFGLLDISNIGKVGQPYDVFVKLRYSFDTLQLKRSGSWRIHVADVLGTMTNATMVGALSA